MNEDRIFVLHLDIFEVTDGSHSQCVTACIFYFICQLLVLFVSSVVLIGTWHPYFLVNSHACFWTVTFSPLFIWHLSSLIPFLLHHLLATYWLSQYLRQRQNAWCRKPVGILKNINPLFSVCFILVSNNSITAFCWLKCSICIWYCLSV